MDEDVKASGFTAEVEQDCNEFLFVDNTTEDSESEDSESDGKDSESLDDLDEKAVEVSEQTQELSRSTENQDVAKLTKDDEFQALNQSKQRSKELDIENELVMNFNKLFPSNSNKQAGEDGGNEMSRDLMCRLRLDSDTRSLGGASRASSSAYVSTTIPPSVIKQRLQRQSAKQAKKEKCRRAVRHGEASLKTRLKKDTSEDIRASVSAVWY